jgi:hypothetical protein
LLLILLDRTFYGEIGLRVKQGVGFGGGELGAYRIEIEIELMIRARSRARCLGPTTKTTTSMILP